MTGFTPATEQAILDEQFPSTGGTDYVAWSTDGATEWDGLPRTAIGPTGWAAATGGSPSTKATAVTLVSDDATSSGTVSHFAIFSAATGGTQRIDWSPLTDTKTLAAGDSLKIAAGALTILLD